MDFSNSKHFDRKYYNSKCKLDFRKWFYTIMVYQPAYQCDGF